MTVNEGTKPINPINILALAVLMSVKVIVSIYSGIKGVISWKWEQVVKSISRFTILERAVRISNTSGEN